MFFIITFFCRLDQPYFMVRVQLISYVQLRPIPEGAPYDGHEHPARNRDGMGLHLLEPRQNFRGGQVLHRVGPAMVCLHAVVREFVVLCRAKDCTETIHLHRLSGKPCGRLVPVCKPYPFAARDRARLDCTVLLCERLAVQGIFEGRFRLTPE